MRRVDHRNVIVAGECDPVGGELTKTRSPSEPIADG